MCFIDILLQFQFHKENKISNPRVYILLKNYPWHPGPTKHERNMKQTWNKHENQHVNQQDIVILCFDAVVRFIDILFAISVPQKQNQNLQPQGLHTQKLSLASRAYILLKKFKAPGSDEHGLFAGGGIQRRQDWRMTRLGSTNLKELLSEATWTWTGSSGIEEVYK